MLEIKMTLTSTESIYFLFLVLRNLIHIKRIIGKCYQLHARVVTLINHTKVILYIRIIYFLTFGLNQISPEWKHPQIVDK